MKRNKALVFSADPSAIAGLCSGANILAEESVAVVLGGRDAAEPLLSCASKVICLGEKAPGAIAESYAGPLAQLIRDEDATVVLLSGSTRDRCIAAKLAVRLGAGVIVDAGAVSVAGDGAIEASRKVYGGAAEATLRAEGLAVIIAAGGIFEETAPAAPGVLVEVAAAPEDDGISLLSTESRQDEQVDITSAKRVVGVGRGIGNEDNLALAGELAAQLGAELGCTRPIAEEEHWLPRGRYIGVSGVTLKPELYLALGVSGQVQHMVGINGSRVVVAVNKDGKAPIFQSCDVGLVADLNKVLPQLKALF